MGTYLKCFTMMALVAVMLGTVSCGKKGKSFGAKVTLNPDKPIVLTGNFSYMKNGAAVEVTGPWFQYHVEVQNDTGEEFVIVSMLVDISGVDTNGTPTTADFTYSAAQNNYSLESGEECNYPHFGQWTKNLTQPLGVAPSSGSLNCSSGRLVFYASGLPDPGPFGSFHFTGKLRLIGWFGTYAKATERFDRTIYFTTQ